jgi:PIN domain nuclease of toxin-antitoxin system
LLLDTNTLIWAQQNNQLLGRDAKRKIEKAGAVYFSSISILEMEIKRMRRQVPISSNFYGNLLEDGFTEIKLTGLHAQSLRNYPSLINHDPFDRILLATADSVEMTFMTGDRKILDLQLPFVIDASE